MPLSNPKSTRERIHGRRIDIQGYKRSDGLWDIEGQIIDIKTRDLEFPHGILAAGEPVHAMHLRLTVNDSLIIIAAEASTDSMPYQGVCGSITEHYRKLQGLRIEPGFRSLVMQRLGGIKGCTHLTELVMAIATTALQTLAGLIPAQEETVPFHLDGCHALDRSGEVVARYYPRWVRVNSDLAK